MPAEHLPSSSLSLTPTSTLAASCRPSKKWLHTGLSCGRTSSSSKVISTDMATLPLDILGLAAHRDDVEQTCGGTLLKMAQRGYRTGILDLTQGEMGTRGTAQERAREAAEAAKILHVSWRQALDIPDGRVENTWENRFKVARVIREQRPRVVILPYWEGRHPDHCTTSKLGYEACFLAGLPKLEVEQTLSSQHSAFSQVKTEDVGTTVGANVSATVGTGVDRTVKGHGFSRAERNPEAAALAAGGLSAHRPFKIIYAT